MLCLQWQITSIKSRTVIVFGDNFALVTFLALQETWEPDERLRCSYLVPEFICVAAVSADTPQLTALYSKIQETSSKSCSCCQDPGKLPLVRICMFWVQQIFSSSLTHHCVHVMFSQLCKIMILIANWCYFHILAESMDDIWQDPTYQGANIFFTGPYQIKMS